MFICMYYAEVISIITKRDNLYSVSSLTYIRRYQTNVEYNPTITGYQKSRGHTVIIISKVFKVNQSRLWCSMHYACA